MEKSIFTKKNNNIEKIKPIHFSDEKILQDFIEEIIKKEHSLLSMKIIGYKREVSTISGRSDFVLVDTNGRPIIIECKLFGNPEIRRNVIAQLIDYASEQNELLKIKDWIKFTNDDIEIDIENNDIMLCIICDGVPTQLHRIIDFLNNKGIIIKIITINKFSINNVEYFTITSHETEPEIENRYSQELLKEKVKTFSEYPEKIKIIIEKSRMIGKNIAIKPGKKRISIHINGLDEKFAIWLSQPGIRGIKKANISIPKFTFQPCSEEKYENIIKKIKQNFNIHELNYDDVMYYIEIDEVFERITEFINCINNLM
jgi:hypothetical protein